MRTSTLIPTDLYPPGHIVDVPVRFRSSYPRCADGSGTLSHLFFSDDDVEIARARAVCRSCGLAVSCLDGALAREEAYGVWGGMLVMNGVAVEARRHRGRPPKQPVAAPIVDEVPVPQHLVA